MTISGMPDVAGPDGEKRTGIDRAYMGDGRERKYSRGIPGKDIHEKTMVTHYFNSLFSLVDTFISEGKKGSAESILEDIKYSYSIAPIQIKDVENRLLEYDRNGFSPRVKKSFNDSIYSN